MTQASPEERGEAAEVTASLPGSIPSPRRPHWLWRGGCLLCVAIPLLLIALLFLTMQKVGKWVECAPHMRSISIALQNYQSIYGTFPPVYTTDESGQPLHSWRTLLLPIFGQEDLYGQLRLDEPWNSAHNLAVFTNSKIRIYHCLSSNTDEYFANYVMVTGPEFATDGPTPFEYDNSKDDSSDVMLIVETTEPIHWFEPKDLRSDEISFKVNDGTSPGISSNHFDMVHAIFADGTVRTLRKNADPRLVRELLRRKKTEDQKLIDEFFQDK